MKKSRSCDCQKDLDGLFDNKVPRRRRKLHILRSRLKPRAQSFRCSSSPTKCILRFVGSQRPMETGATLCASVDRQRRPIRRSLRRRKLHIPRSRLKPRAQSFRCSSSPNECESHSLGTRSIFGDVHAAAENDPSPFRAHMARNSARLFGKLKREAALKVPPPACVLRMYQMKFWTSTRSMTPGMPRIPATRAFSAFMPRAKSK